MPLSSGFLANVQKSTSGCWHWTGRVDGNGYGTLTVGSRTDGTRRNVPAHRWAYEQTHGQLPARGEPGHQQVDHECHNLSRSCPGGRTCRHRRCVNPAHLVARTPKANGAASDRSTASVNRAKTHCSVCDTELVAPNVYLARNGSRKCKPCAKRRAAVSKVRRRAAAAA